ncbi:hypothetical protein LCGC14_2984090, partial [marine sediment metagenome]
MKLIWAIIAAGFCLRLGLTLAHNGFLGVDGGAYFLNMLDVLGQEHTEQGFPRPLLAPGWTLFPFAELFGWDIGYKIWASVA